MFAVDFLYARCFAAFLCALCRDLELVDAFEYGSHLAVVEVEFHRHSPYEG